MENASKALLIAAEVLISIIIIGALMLMFNSLTDYQKVTEKNEEEAQIIEFNNSYEAYNQSDVRGNELYSLINKVVDYNRRKSTKGTGINDEGQYLKYEPMTLVVDLTRDENAKKDLIHDDTFRIFKGEYSKEFEINSTNNTFDELFENIINWNRNYTSRVMINLATAIEKIYENIDSTDDLSDDKKIKIINDFNSAIGKQVLDINNINCIKNGNKSLNIPSKEHVYEYYEYLQFTRAHFMCTNTEYNEGTGRIVKMEFKYTGKIS